MDDITPTENKTAPEAVDGMAPPVVSEPAEEVSTAETAPEAAPLPEPVAEVVPTPAEEEPAAMPEPEAAATAAPVATDAIHKKSAMPLIMIIVVLVVVALAAAAYFAFVKKDAKPATPASQTTATATTVTTSDPDTVSKSIDSSLSKIDDSKDYSSDGLSDTTLGL